jgi:transposase
LIGSDLDGQRVLVPLQARDVLPADHRVWQVLDQVAEFDLAPFLSAYRSDGVGRPPYHPRLLLALIIYCYGKRQCSLREIRTACRDDLGARAIMGGRVPGLRTLSEFMNTHRKAICGLLPATLAMGEVEGLVDVTVVAGDGTKVVANAAMAATTDEAGLRAQITDLEAEIEATAATWADQVAANGDGADTSTWSSSGLFDQDDLDQGEPVTGGGPRRGGDEAAWRRLGVLTRLLGARQEALTYLVDHPPATALADWREQLQRDTARVTRHAQQLQDLRARLQAAWDERQHALAVGQVFLGPPMVAVDQHSQIRRGQQRLDKATARAAKTAAARPVATRVNTTDPASRIMPGKHDGFDSRYNVQALACKNQFILAVTVHDSPNDKQALQALLTAGRANLDDAGITQAIETALFDAGYASQANFTATDLPVTTLLVSVEKECRQTGRLRDGISTAAAAWQTMADTLADPANAALYKRRAAIIEPVFAQLFQVFGRGLHTRGETVETELHLWAITHNLNKITRARRKKRAI